MAGETLSKAAFLLSLIVNQSYSNFFINLSDILSWKNNVKVQMLKNVYFPQ